MKKLFCMILCLVTCTAFCFVLTGCGSDKDEGISITVVNNTEQTISEIYFIEEKADKWGKNCLSEDLRDGEKAVVSVNNSSGDDYAGTYAIKVHDENGDCMDDIRELELENGDYITFFFNGDRFCYTVNNDMDEDDADLGNIDEDFYGEWVYEATGEMIEIKKTDTWEKTDEDGEIVARGTCTMGEDCLILLYQNGDKFTELSFDGMGRLIDSDGEFLTPRDQYDKGKVEEDKSDDVEKEDGEKPEEQKNKKPYSWTDKSGNVWYWNGKENVFIGSGKDYYVEDGKYYEQNDSGWSEDDYYYDDSQDQSDAPEGNQGGEQ